MQLRILVLGNCGGSKALVDKSSGRLTRIHRIYTYVRSCTGVHIVRTYVAVQVYILYVRT